MKTNKRIFNFFKTMLFSTIQVGLVVATFSSVYSSTALAESGGDSGYLTYDLGVSSGSTNGNSYTEGNLGLNYWFSPSVAWRNSIFGRFQKDEDTQYGIDTTFRGQQVLKFGESAGATMFAGAGYRFINKGKNAPLAEGGLIFHLGGLSIGGGAKAVFNELVDKTMKTDVQYFIVLGGGGRI